MPSISCHTSPPPLFYFILIFLKKYAAWTCNCYVLHIRAVHIEYIGYFYIFAPREAVILEERTFSFIKERIHCTPVATKPFVGTHYAWLVCRHHLIKKNYYYFFCIVFAFLSPTSGCEHFFRPHLKCIECKWICRCLLKKEKKRNAWVVLALICTPHKLFLLLLFNESVTCVTTSSVFTNVLTFNRSQKDIF